MYFNHVLSFCVLFCLNLEPPCDNKYKINLSGLMFEMINPQMVSQQVQMSPEDKAAIESAEEIIGSLSSKQRYLKVFSYTYKNAVKNFNKKAPKIVVYQQKENLTIRDLVYKYAALTGQDDDATNIEFVLKGGYKLDKEKTVNQTKKMLRLDNLDGLEIYMEMLSDFLYINQCSVQSMIQNQQSFNTQAILVPFALPGMNYSIYAPIQGKKGKSKNQELFQQVLTFLSTEIQRIFGKTVNKSNIELVFNSKENQQLNQKIQFFFLDKKDTVQVRFKDQIKLPPPPRQNNSFLIISGYGITSKKLHYDDIKEKRLQDVLNQIQPRPNWNWSQFGLLINELVIKPEQNFLKAQAYMKNPNAISKNFAGKIIPEILIFLAEQQRIKKVNKFDIEQIVDKSQGNLVLRTTCESKIKDRADKTKHVHFKGQLKYVAPILLYTSELQVKPSDKTPSCSLYRGLNICLRNLKFLLITQKDYKEKWEIPFTSELLEQLKKIDPVKNQVLWRGVSYLPDHKVGDRILYKQFNSTTTNQKLAKQLFANEALFKITKSNLGKPIKDFSYYQIENEVLFEPYIQFQVKNVSKITNEEKKKTITLFQIEEIPRPEMPDSKALYLLWVDDKTKEGLMMWNSLKDIKDTSVMVPLLTTDELDIWLKKNQTLLQDKTVQFVLVTNMTRVEKGVKKDQAGVEAINLYRKVKPQGHIFVYIGWVEGTLNKLKKYNLNPNDKLKVSNVEENLRKFLNEVGGLK